MSRGWFAPVAVFTSADGGEWCVSPPYAGRYRVFGPHTCDSLASFVSEREAVERARALSTCPFTGAEPRQEWPPVSVQTTKESTDAAR